MRISTGYLMRLMEIETPRWKHGMANDKREGQCQDYCRLRNLAKDLLANSQNDQAEERLSELVNKLGLKIN